MAWLAFTALASLPELTTRRAPRKLRCQAE